MRTRAELLDLGMINPELDAILKIGPPLPDMGPDSDISTIRATIAGRKSAMAQLFAIPKDAAYVEEDRQIPVRDGESINVRIHSPKKPPADGSPVFVVYHKGGFILGDLDDEAALCRSWAELGGVAVNVEYHLAPNVVFPIPVWDAYDALKWGLFLGGISAGANLAAVISHFYIEDKISPPLAGMYLGVPSTVTPGAPPEKYKDAYLSREQCREAPILNARSMAMTEKLYKPDNNSPLRCPVLFPSYEGLPPTYFQICGIDPLRDDGLIYEDILRGDYGIETKVDLYPGLPHGFWYMWPKAAFSKKYQEDCIGALWMIYQVSEQGYLKCPGLFAFTKGMPIMLQQNTNTSSGLANGMRGVAEEVILDSDVQCTTELDDQFILCTVPLQCVLVRPTHDHNLSFSDVPDSLVPFFPVQIRGQIPNIPGLSFYRHQVLLTLGFAFIDYKSQGSTLVSLILDLVFGDLYNDEESGLLEVILLEQARVSIQLEIEGRTLGILKNLIRLQGESLTVVNPLHVKVAESDYTSSNFTRGDASPDVFDGTSTDDDHDDDIIDASCFTGGDKVAIRAWFGSYVFTDKAGKIASGPAFRLLKLWRLLSALPSLNNSPVIKRKRIL
ncbi:hypothetical protein B7463_g11397, partial [Scytalidium lignicola]